MVDDLTPATAVLYGELKGRVQAFEDSLRNLRYDIEKQFDTLAKNLEALNNTVIANARPRWLEISSFAGLFLIVVGALWTVTVVPVRTDLDKLVLRHDALADKTEAELKTTISQAQVSDLKAEMKAKIDELNTKIDQLNKRGK